MRIQKGPNMRKDHEGFDAPKTMSNLTSASGEASASSGNRTEIGSDYSQQYFATPPTQTETPQKKKRNLPGNPDPEAEVVALSPKTLLATNRFICEICSKGFQRDQNLQLHRRGHNLPWKLKQRTSKEIRKKVYVCPEATCVHHDPSRALGDLTGIKKHFCRKHGEKKWKCDKCSKKYAVQSDWKAHSKTCGTREYRCDCGTLFSRRDSFITHRAFCDALAEESARSVTGIDMGIGIPNNSATTPTTPAAGVVISSSSHHHHHHHQEIHGNSFPLKKEQEGFMPPWLQQPPSTIDLSSSSSSFFSHHENPNPRGGGGGGPILPPYPTAPSPPHMSATALLQKAAQMGATITKTGSMIRTHQQPHVSPHSFNLSSRDHQMTPTSNTTTGVGVGVSSSLLHHVINSFSSPFEGTSFEDPFHGAVTKTSAADDRAGGGGGGGNYNETMTRDFLGLRPLSHTDILNIAGMGNCMNSQLNQTQNPWQGKFAADANSKTVSASSIPDGWMGLDIGPDSIKTFSEALDATQTVIWNGPMGVFEFEKFAAGTEAIAKKLAELSGKGVTTIIGGGDSVAAVEKAGLADKMSHISTGGGASLELLEGKPLPGVLALNDA